MPSATGTATSSAISALTTVPKASAAMPNRGGLSFGNQSVSVKKFASSARSAGIAFAIRKTVIATMMTRTIVPAARVRPRKMDSAPNPLRRGSAPPPPSPPPLVRSPAAPGRCHPVARRERRSTPMHRRAGRDW